MTPTNARNQLPLQHASGKNVAALKPGPSHHETGVNFLVRTCTVRPNLSSLSVDLLPFSIDSDHLTEFSTGIGRAGDEENQILMHLISRLILPTSANGLEGSVMVIDCNSRWLPASILHQVHRAVSVSCGDKTTAAAQVRAALSRIYVCACNALEDIQEKILPAALKLITQQPSISLIVFDSITDFYTIELCQARCSDLLVEQKFTRAAANLQEMAFKLRTPIVVVKRRSEQICYPPKSMQQQQAGDATETVFISPPVDAADRLGRGYRMRFNQWLQVKLLSLGVSDIETIETNIPLRNIPLRTMVRLEGLKKDGSSKKDSKIWFANIKLLAPFGIDISSKGNSNDNRNEATAFYTGLLRRPSMPSLPTKRSRRSLEEEQMAAAQKRKSATDESNNNNSNIVAYYNDDADGGGAPTLSQMLPYENEMANDAVVRDAEVFEEEIDCDDFFEPAQGAKQTTPANEPPSDMPVVVITYSQGRTKNQ